MQHKLLVDQQAEIIKLSVKVITLAESSIENLKTKIQNAGSSEGVAILKAQQHQLQGSLQSARFKIQEMTGDNEMIKHYEKSVARTNTFANSMILLFKKDGSEIKKTVKDALSDAITTFEQTKSVALERLSDLSKQINLTNALVNDSNVSLASDVSQEAKSKVKYDPAEMEQFGSILVDQSHSSSQQLNVSMGTTQKLSDTSQALTVVNDKIIELDAPRAPTIRGH